MGTYNSSRQGERLLALEKERDEQNRLKARSAQVRAEISHFGRDHHLVVVNDGAVTARNVTVLLDGHPMMQNRLVLRGQTEIKKLGPGVDVGYLLAVMMGSPDLLDVRITWEDDTGEPRSWGIAVEGCIGPRTTVCALAVPGTNDTKTTQKHEQYERRLTKP